MLSRTSTLQLLFTPETSRALPASRILSARGPAPLRLLGTDPGLRITGFGVIERQLSMLSRCKRGNPPKLEWDPAENCSRLVLTYELESAAVNATARQRAEALLRTLGQV